MRYEGEVGACLRELLGESAFDLPAKRLVPYIYLLQLEGVDFGFDFCCNTLGFRLRTGDEFNFRTLMRRAKAASIGAELEPWAREAINRVRSWLSIPSFPEWLWASMLAEVHFNYTLVMRYSSGDKHPAKDEVYSRLPPEHRIRGLFEYAWNALGLSSQLG